jgi:ATP-dependent Lon protease
MIKYIYDKILILYIYMESTFQKNIITKINQLQEIVQNVIRSNQIYKTKEILDTNELNLCITFAENIFTKLKNVLKQAQAPLLNIDTDTEYIINTVQAIISEMSFLINLYGCDTIDNLLYVCIGHKYTIEPKYLAKYKLLNAYFSPTRYKIVDWKKLTKNTGDDFICKNADNFECFEIKQANLNFNQRVYGLKIAIHNIEKQQTLIVQGLVEDVLISLMENDFVKIKLDDMLEQPPIAHPLFREKSYDRFQSCLTLRDILLYPAETLKNNYIIFLEQFNGPLQSQSLDQNIQTFLAEDLYAKRNTLINLLIHSDQNEAHYLAYLLYDLLSSDIHGVIDTYDQTTIHDSFPWPAKQYFREAMKQTISYTKKDSSKVSFEQRICMLKTDDLVKEKALVKLKEVKTKPEDTGSKAMQFLEGLMKIPFGIYKEEPVLRIMPNTLSLFSALIQKLAHSAPKHLTLPFPLKAVYTSLELHKYVPLLKSQYKTAFQTTILTEFKVALKTFSKAKMSEIYGYLAPFMLMHPTAPKITMTGQTLLQLRTQLLHLLEFLVQHETDRIYEWIETMQNNPLTGALLNHLNQQLQTIQTNITGVQTFMSSVKDTLDQSVYGHTKAKRQIERIIGQWLNGDITGYCFGFEGPPGVGKTSLAKKGISCCLKDEAGEARPFAFIAMGGSTNSSTLDGHNYTYVGSSWGRIVDILMDTKIMNPIIFIDELDKLSKTENGKEIIGILTHLIDQTQNDAFQDKYFTGINLNLSRALFIFSYNDVTAIDHILLDRIHRIKFDHLSVADKLVITRNYILPEIYKKMGLCEMVVISDELIEFIIEHYTAEPGVRKLKEIMFEILGEINLATLTNPALLNEIPMIITAEQLRTQYLKDRHELKPAKIHSTALVGVINGLWANAVGKGGVLPIEASFFPCNTFLELKLTGMQGDVMKESMTVAKSLAWTLFSAALPKKAQPLQKNIRGLHIHVPEGATPKDGPSAGTAITVVMYSLFSGLKIKNDLAITGEICLQGRVTAIGGLDLKILGGIRAGVKTFIYPKDNHRDFTDFAEKHSLEKFPDITFIPVETIAEVFSHVFLKQ